MSNGYSNAVLVRELFAGDGPFVHIAETFVAARCAGCGSELDHDPRYGEWGGFCASCWPHEHGA